MAKDKNTIINQLVGNAADVMENKMDYNEIVAEMMDEKGDHACAKRLRDMNTNIAAAVELMRENGGCWA